MDPVVVLLVMLFTLLFLCVVYGAVRIFKGVKKRSGRKVRLLHKVQTELKRNPHDRVAMNDLAELYYREKEWTSAQHAYRALFGENPLATVLTAREFEQRLNYAISAYMSKDINHAHSLFVRLGTSKHTSFEYYKYYGLCAYERKDFAAALSNLRSAQSAVPDDRVVRKYIAFTYYKINRLPTAQSQLEAISVTDTDPEVQYMLANIYFKGGARDKALEMFSRVVKSELHTVVALVAIAEIYRNENNIPKALDYYTRALRASDLSGSTLEVGVLYSLSTLLIEMNKSKTALKHLNRIEKLQPNYKDTRALISELTFSVDHRTLDHYLQSSAVELESIASKIIPLLLRRPISNIAARVASNQRYHDYGVSIQTGSARETSKVLVRFARAQKVIEEPALRELYGRMNDGRFIRGVFVTAGHFSQEAQHFVSSRAITLCSGDTLRPLLERIVQ